MDGARAGIKADHVDRPENAEPGIGTGVRIRDTRREPVG